MTFISPLYVGGISDVEITRVSVSVSVSVSGFLETLEGKSGISIMADRGFTIKNLLDKIGVKLNISPFMNGRPQLPPEEVKNG